MEEKPDIEAVLRRVRKLLAIAEDARGDANECAAAASQAEKIMRKYQIDNASVLLAGMQNTQDFERSSVGAGLDPFDRQQAHHSAAGILAVAVAKLYDTQAALVRGAKGMELQFCGLRLDAILSRYTYLMLLASMDANAVIWKKRNKASAGQHHAFLMGYAVEVAKLLRAAKAEKDAEAQREHAFGALVLAKGALVRQHFGDPSYSRASAPNSDAAAAGRAAGREADIGRRGIEATAAARLQIGSAA